MSSTRQRGKDHAFSSKSPHFFKIILEGTIIAGKLGIPKKFVKKYGSSLPNVMFLRVPSGPDWQVELSRHNGDVWLHNGWREFAEHYSLEYGHLLVFEHKGCSQFYVMIFDKSATEINYPCYGTIGSEEPNFGGEGKEPETEEPVNDDSVEISDVLTRSKRARASFESFHPNKKIRNDLACQTKHSSRSVPLRRQNVSQSNGLKPGTSSCSLKKFGEEGAGSMSSGRRRSKAGFVERTLSLTSEDKAEALERASAFLSENPYFVIAMQPAYVHRLAIPNHFSRKHLGEKQSNVTLCVSDGRTWSAKYCFYGSPSKSMSSVISNGWRAFVRDTSLKVGDVCAFELIRSCEIKFKVFFFRAVEDTNIQHSLGNENRPNSVEPRRSLETNIVSDCTCKNQSRRCELCAGGQVSQRPSCSRTANVVKEENKFTSEYPFFRVVMSSSSLRHGCLVVPKIFVSKCSKQREQEVTLTFAGKSWPATLVSYPGGGNNIIRGWTTFARENALQVGDACVFELVNTKAVVLKVSILRNSR